MCRIAGVWDRSAEESDRLFWVEQMNLLQAKGGPDASGLENFAGHGLTLGHRRLSLLDLSSTGDQPMVDASHRYWISYNGEVYNFQELRQELEQSGYTFRSTSDTEVILAGFTRWHTAVFGRLAGMFALALWDIQDGTLYLVRDRMGIKPLFWGGWKTGIAFASSVRALASLPELNQPSEQWQVYLLAFGHLPEPITTQANVKPVPAGHYLCFSSSTEAPTVNFYGATSTSTAWIKDVKEAQIQVRHSLEAAVKRHLICDAPIGVFLSGGIDSGILAQLAHRHTKALRTTSIYFTEAGYSEHHFQELLRQQLTHGAHHLDLITGTQFFKHLPRVLADEDQPTCDGINTWFISKMAREAGLKAVISGIGGDELFGGYPSFKRMGMVRSLKRVPNSIFSLADRVTQKKMKRLLYLGIPGAAGMYLFLRGLFVPREIARHLDMSEQEVWRILSNVPGNTLVPGKSNFEQAEYVETHWYLKNQLLRDADNMSMAHGLEIRVPFLDPMVMETANRIHPTLKAAGQYPKQLLIDSFDDLLPEAIWKRPKMGFSFPFAEWFSHHPGSKDFFDPDLHESVDALRAGQLHWSQLYVLQLARKHSWTKAFHI